MSTHDICESGGKLCVKQDTGGLNKVETERRDRGGLAEEGDFLLFWINNVLLIKDAYRACVGLFVPLYKHLPLCIPVQQRV